jgi:hypothetical protein
MPRKNHHVPKAKPFVLGGSILSLVVLAGAVVASLAMEHFH